MDHNSKAALLSCKKNNSDQSFLSKIFLFDFNKQNITPLFTHQENWQSFVLNLKCLTVVFSLQIIQPWGRKNTAVKFSIYYFQTDLPFSREIRMKRPFIIYINKHCRLFSN